MHAQLLHNNWFGKAIGATCGWIWAPADPLWLAVALIAGIGFGHLYDLWASQYHDNDDAALNRLARHHAHSGSPHLEFLFAALGRIAKASGPVTAQHIAHAEKLMQQMALDADTQALAKDWFNQGKVSSYPMHALSRECLQPTEQGSASRLTILRCMCTATAVRVNDQALATLKQLGGYLGFAPPRVAREFGAVHNPTHHEHSAQPSASPPDSEALLQAFECLELAPGSSGDNVKHAYRKLVSKYHPDKLPLDAPEQDKQHAQKRMVELRRALDLIQQQHS